MRQLDGGLVGLFGLILVACQPGLDAPLKSAPAQLDKAEPAKESAPPTADVPEAKSEVVATIELSRLLEKPTDHGLKKVQVVVGKEPFYAFEGRQFEGYDFTSIMKLVPELGRLDPTAHRLRFVCTDGYETTFPFSSIEGARGVMANRVMNQGEWGPFPEKKRGSTMQTAGPWYLVWENLKYGSKRPWPYQLTRIEVLSNSAYAAGVAPPENAGVNAGFKLFQKHCQACHTINLKGGRMGPELNVPRNVTEYRQREYLRAFIKNPRSFRATSTMPPMPLTSSQIDEILAYLSAMAGRKVCSGEQACTALLSAQ